MERSAIEKSAGSLDKITEAFHKLLEITYHLLGPTGCPWDKEQTLITLRKSVLEEVYELVEAIDLNEDQKIKEELGDLFFNALFLSVIAEKENRVDPALVIEAMAEKLIRRHPHVFGKSQVSGHEALYEQWERIKLAEPENAHRTSLLDGIPKGLPALFRGQKILKKIKKSKFDCPSVANVQEFASEEELGELLFGIVAEAQKKGIDAEQALSKVLTHLESSFRSWESGQNQD